MRLCGAQYVGDHPNSALFLGFAVSVVFYRWQAAHCYG